MVSARPSACTWRIWCGTTLGVGVPTSHLPRAHRVHRRARALRRGPPVRTLPLQLSVCSACAAMVSRAAAHRDSATLLKGTTLTERPAAKGMNTSLKGHHTWMARLRLFWLSIKLCLCFLSDDFHTARASSLPPIPIYPT